MKKLEASSLEGTALDWAVAKCEGLAFEWDEGAAWVYPPEFNGYVAALKGHKANSLFYSFSPSTNWSQGGPIIDRERLFLRYWTNSWRAETYFWIMYGPTPLIAAMRCYVASKLGDDVEIPEELIELPLSS